MYTVEELQSSLQKKIESDVLSDVQLTLSDEDRKTTPIVFHYGWNLSYSIDSSYLGGRYPRMPGFQDCGSAANAAVSAKRAVAAYESGKDSTYLDRLRVKAGTGLNSFLTGNMDLGGGGGFIGRDNCSSCGGRGSKSCHNCTGGQSYCNRCGGSGQVHETQFDGKGNSRMVTNSCNTCWGSGRVTCSTCGGSSRITCSTCSGTGDAYYGYVVQGSAKRNTASKLHGDSHEWTDSFVTSKGLEIAQYLSNTKVVPLDDLSAGYSVSFRLEAVLPTLELKAEIKEGKTEVRFAGKDQLIDAGCLMEPAFWEAGSKLGATGSVDSDKAVLAVPASQDLLRHHEDKDNSELISSNWISQDIYSAFIDRYERLVTEIKNQNKKGLVTGFLTRFLALFSGFSLLVFFIGALIPNAAIHFHSVAAFTGLDLFRLQNLPETMQYIDRHYFSYPMDLFWEVSITTAVVLYGTYKLVPKIHWKPVVSKLEALVTATLLLWLLPYAYHWVYTICLTIGEGLTGKLPGEGAWYQYGASMFLQTTEELAIFTAVFAFLIMSFKYWKKTDASVRVYGSEVLNKRFKLS